MAKPIWLLDLDGVINALGRVPATEAWPLEEWVLEEVANKHGNWPIRTARPVISFINYVHQTDGAEIRWHTTWQEEANKVSTAIGLPEFPIQDAPEYDESAWGYYDPAKWWKLGAVERLLQQGYRVLWTDDDITYALDRPTRLRLQVQGCRIISPASREGIIQRQINQITSYLMDCRKLN